MKTIPLVLEQHAEEAAFLWLLRDAAVGEPHYDLPSLARLDGRVEAHVDGLRVAGDAAWPLVKAALAHEEPGEAFAAASLAFESGDPARIKTVFDACAAAPAMLRGVVSALGWMRWDAARKHAEKLVASAAPAERLVALAAAGVHRASLGQALLAAARDHDHAVQARAIRTIGELGLLEHAPLLQRRITTSTPDLKSAIRFWAAWSLALRTGDPNAMTHLKDVAKVDAGRRLRALAVMLRRLTIGEGHNGLKRLQESPALARPAVQAAGILGDPALVPWLLEKMKEPPLARLAGEAFSMITGCDLAYENFDGDKPEGFKAGPTDDPKDENVAMDSDENLPWPKLELVTKWWNERSRNFQSGARHLAGQPVTPEHCAGVLRTGKQRQRAAAALELAIFHPKEPLFEVRAPAMRQSALLR